MAGELGDMRRAMIGRASRSPRRRGAAVSDSPAEYEYGGIAVRRARAGDVRHLREVLARAFDDDPAANWFCRQDRRRTERLERMFGFSLRWMSLPYGTAYTTDDLSGAALWSPPGESPPSLLNGLRMLPDLVRATGATRLASRMRGLRDVERRRPKAQHWYLQVLGTEPAFQGRGIGSALLRPVLNECDRVGTPAYLETAKEGNIAFYERSGFRVVGEMDMLGNGPHLWLMQRDVDQTPTASSAVDATRSTGTNANRQTPAGIPIQ